MTDELLRHATTRKWHLREACLAEAARALTDPAPLPLCAGYRLTWEGHAYLLLNDAEVPDDRTQIVVCLVARSPEPFWKHWHVRAVACAGFADLIPDEARGVLGTILRPDPQRGDDFYIAEQKEAVCGLCVPLLFPDDEENEGGEVR